jgi:hypothetical protein
VSAHAAIVVDQFTRQAAPFANAAATRHAALRLLVELSGAIAAGTVLGDDRARDELALLSDVIMRLIRRPRSRGPGHHDGSGSAEKHRGCRD